MNNETPDIGAAPAGVPALTEPTEEQIAKGAHVLSEWLDDMAPLNERRYREPARAAYKAMLALAPAGAQVGEMK